MEYRLYRDGSFDILAAEGRIALMGGYPALDGCPVRPVAVTLTDDCVEYLLCEGSLRLQFARSQAGVTLDVSAQGVDPHDIAYFSAAHITGCAKGFGEGFGITGPSGFRDLNAGENYTSDALVALGNDGDGKEAAVLTLCFADQHHFRNRFTVQDGILSALVDTEQALFDHTAAAPVCKPLPTLFFAEATDFYSGLSACAHRIADEMHACPAKEPAFHWCSWYYLYHNLDQQLLEEYTKGFAAYRQQLPMTHIQIDAGYFHTCGEWLTPSSYFPDGMEKAAKTIIDAGFEPGIWIAPFMVGDESFIARQHPDWLLHNADGTLHIQSMQYNEPKVWGYRDFEYYVLDTSNPQAFKYIIDVFRTLHSWGYTLFKTDFMFWGLQDSTTVRRYSPGKTSFEYFRELLTAIRDAIGDSRWLGCIAPYMPALGFVNMMRIAGDVGAQWDEHNSFGPANMIQELTADAYFNNVYWQNDPDAVMLRDFHIYLQQPQIEALALLAAVSGGCIYTSDPVHKIAPERRKLLEMIRPNGLHSPEYPCWQKKTETTCIVNRLAQGAVIYWFNATGREQVETPDWQTLCGEKMGYAMAYGGGESLPLSKLPYIKIPARSGKLFFVTEQPLEKQPENLWVW